MLQWLRSNRKWVLVFIYLYKGKKVVATCNAYKSISDINEWRVYLALYGNIESIWSTCLSPYLPINRLIFSNYGERNCVFFRVFYVPTQPLLVPRASDAFFLLFLINMCTCFFSHICMLLWVLKKLGSGSGLKNPHRILSFSKILSHRIK